MRNANHMQLLKWISICCLLLVASACQQVPAVPNSETAKPPSSASGEQRRQQRQTDNYGPPRILGTLQDADSIATVLELIVGYKCNERGAGEPVDKWIDKLHAARADAGLTSVAAWALADRDTRAIGPFTTVTKDEYIREQLASGSLDALREAQRLFPWDPQVSDKGVAR